jgi:hypothetical protein
MFFFTFLSPQEYLWRKRYLSTSWLTTGKEIYIDVSWCIGVWMGGKETCMCKFDGSFSTCGIVDWEFYWIRQTTIKVAASKVLKHERVCFHNHTQNINYFSNRRNFNPTHKMCMLIQLVRNQTKYIFSSRLKKYHYSWFITHTIIVKKN